MLLPKNDSQKYEKLCLQEVRLLLEFGRRR